MCSVDPIYILYLIWLLIETSLVTIAKFHETKLCECTHAISYLNFCDAILQLHVIFYLISNQREHFLIWYV